MKQIVPWRDDRRGDRRDDENEMTSLMLGVPSLAIGLVGIILLLSLLVGNPIEALGYYEVAIVPNAFTDALGRKIEGNPAEYLVPSIALLAALCVGALLGGLGIYLGRAD